MAVFRQDLLSLWFQPRFVGAAWFLARPSWLLLWPLLLLLSRFFRAVVALRRGLYRLGVLRAQRLPVPVVVVGNIIVGGAGKTPLTIHLVQALRAAGRRPGIISRGYGGTAGHRGVQAVQPDDTPAVVGDEPLLLARRTGVPVVVGADRVAAGRALLAAHPGVDLLVCDDGLQHYRLARDVEIAVMDGRGIGNGRLLPAGPLREPAGRLASVTAVVGHAGAEALWQPLAARTASFTLRLQPGPFASLADPLRQCAADALRGRKLYAIAGIGAPERFFATLESLGLTGCTARAFPDHHAYTAADLAFARDGVLLMTEKDAVKCRPLYSGEAWVLPVDATVTPDLALYVHNVLEKLHGRPAA